MRRCGGRGRGEGGAGGITDSSLYQKSGYTRRRGRGEGLRGVFIYIIMLRQFLLHRGLLLLPRRVRDVSGGGGDVGP